MKAAKSKDERVIPCILCSLVMAFQPALAGVPAAPLGRMSSTGSVWLDGVAAPAGTNVYPGSLISTGSRAAVYVALARGGKLVLGGSTIARVSATGNAFFVALDRGVIGVLSESHAPVVIHAYGITIRTKEPEGAYQVALAGNSLRVLARQGGALVEAPNRTVELAPGKLMEANVAPENFHSNTTNHKNRNAFLLVLVAFAIVGASTGIALAPSGSTCVAVSTSGFTCQ